MPSSSGVVDAVVIGAGHNGLVAAAMLADAGWGVAVLEAQSEPGGAVRSAELFPGYISDLYSATAGLRGCSTPDGGRARRRSTVPKRRRGTRAVQSGESADTTGTSGNRSRSCSARASLRTMLMVTIWWWCAPAVEQPAHCRGGGVVEDDPVEPDAEVLLRRAAEHQHGDGVDQRLGGDLVGIVNPAPAQPVPRPR